MVSSFFVACSQETRGLLINERGKIFSGFLNNYLGKKVRAFFRKELNVIYWFYLVQPFQDLSMFVISGEVGYTVLLHRL